MNLKNTAWEFRLDSTGYINIRLSSGRLWTCRRIFAFHSSRNFLIIW